MIEHNRMKSDKKRADRQSKKEIARELSNDEHAQLEIRRNAERQAIREPRHDSERQRQLGVFSSGWDEFSLLLKQEFLVVWRCNIHSADQISKVWNGKGFRTGFGALWNADLVNFGRQHLFDIGVLTKK